MKREIEPSIHALLSSENSSVIILEGARQVGKSYTLKKVLSEVDTHVLFFDLEKEAALRRHIDGTEDFEDFHTLMQDRYGLKPGTILCFDEAQESKQLPHYVKSFKEDLPEVRVILSGSSMNRFFPKNMRIPVGRYRSICMFGFSFHEFVEYIKGEELADLLRDAPTKIPASRHKLLLELFDQYMQVGGYPEVVKAYAAEENFFGIMDEILASLEEDFERKEEYQPRLFRNTIQAVANHLGSPSKLTHLDTTKYHAKKILDAMKAWHLVLEVEAQPLNTGKGGSTSFLPKRYLHDIGLVNRWRSMAAPKISILDTIDPVMRTPLGALFENAVMIQLLSGESAFHTIGTWKRDSQSGIEVDFIYPLPARNPSSPLSKGVKVPIECKASLHIKRGHVKNILHYLNASGQQSGVLVSAAPLELLQIEGKKIINLPIYMASREVIRKYVEQESG